MTKAGERRENEKAGAVAWLALALAALLAFAAYWVLTELRRRSDQTEEIILLLFGCLALGAAVSVFLVRRYTEARHTLLVASRSEAARERAVFEAAMDGILVLDRDGAVERANPAAERMFGRGPRRAEGPERQPSCSPRTGTC